MVQRVEKRGHMNYTRWMGREKAPSIERDVCPSALCLGINGADNLSRTKTVTQSFGPGVLRGDANAYTVTRSRGADGKHTNEDTDRKVIDDRVLSHMYN